MRLDDVGIQFCLQVAVIYCSNIEGLYVLSVDLKWSYSGPEHWPGLCMTGMKQSPINIKTKQVTKRNLEKFTFLRYDYPSLGVIINNDHTAVIKLDGDPLKIQGGNLSNAYTLAQMHFHWPAEHTVDNKRDALELHFVHYDSQYTGVSMASQFPNGIAVIAILFKLSNKDNADMVPVVQGVELVSKWTSERTAKLKWKMNPYHLIPMKDKTYYRYYGSLTTPPCEEHVIWSVFAEKLTISKKQINAFKKLETSTGTLHSNYRPVQQLGIRQVYYPSTATYCVCNIFYTLFNFMLIKLFRVT